jgi:hypothetical protein
MSKLDHSGNPIYRADGKVLKGPNYFKPDFSKILRIIKAISYWLKNYEMKKLNSKNIEKIKQTQIFKYARTIFIDFQVFIIIFFNCQIVEK